MFICYSPLGVMPEELKIFHIITEQSDNYKDLGCTETETQGNKQRRREERCRSLKSALMWENLAKMIIY